MLIKQSSALDNNRYFFTLGESCLYGVKADDGLHLIDCGSPVHIPQLRKRLNEFDLESENISAIYLTNNKAERVAGLPLLLRHAPKARIFALQPLAQHLNEESSIEKLHHESKSISDLYPRIRCDALSHEEFRTAFDKIEIITQGSNIEITPGLNIQAISTPGHSEFSTAYYILEHEFLIVDPTIGFFRGKDLPAPGANFSFSKASDSLSMISKLKISSLAFHFTGFIAGSMVTKYLSQCQLSIQSFGEECLNAFRAGVSEEELREALLESVFNTTSPDPLLHTLLEESLKTMVAQVKLSL